MSINSALDSAIHQPLLDRLADNWRMLMVRGVMAIAFGIIAAIFPGTAVMALVTFFGIYVMAEGALLLYAALAPTREALPTWWLILAGLLSIAAGIVALTMPGPTAIVLSIVIGLWAIASGAIQITGAFQLRREIENETLLMASGIVAVLFGLGLVLFPPGGVLALAWIVAFYAITFGILWVTLSLKLKSLRDVLSDARRRRSD